MFGIRYQMFGIRCSVSGIKYQGSRLPIFVKPAVFCQAPDIIG